MTGHIRRKQSFIALAICALVAVCAPLSLRAAQSDIDGVDPALIEDLVAASRILVDQGVLDAFGHVSVRDPRDPGRYLMSRNLAPALVTAADIMVFDVETGEPVDAQGRRVFLERFIHAAIYKSRPDVNAVVHSHSPSVIPFGIVASVPLQPVFHMSGFLYAGVPIYEIRNDAGMSNMLIANIELGRALAGVLADKSVVLMRGHGNVVAAPSIPVAVYRAVYTEVNARLQIQAIALGGPINYLAPEEARKAGETTETQVRRPWELWKSKAMREAQ